MGHPSSSPAGKCLADAAVVLIAIDGARGAILAAVERGAIGASEVAVVGAAHGMLLMADGSFAAFEAMGFASGELPTADALRDAPLLIAFALIDGGCGLRRCNGD